MQTMDRFELAFMHGGGLANLIGVNKTSNGVEFVGRATEK